MVDFSDADLSGSRFERVDLSRSQFQRVRLTDAVIRSADIERTTFRDVGMRQVVMRGGEFEDLDIYGELGRVVVNGVDVVAYVEAELDRRYPDRPAMRAEDPAGFRHAWDVVERLWSDTVAQARRLDPDLLHESVDGEWSFIQTLRHLSFATDAWVRRAILGDPAPWHRLDLPWEEAPPMDGITRDRDVRPSLDEVVELRRDRMASVRSVIDSLTDESLAADTEPVDAPGWPRPRSYPVKDCLRIVLNEEWEHRLYAERDLAVLESRGR